MDIELEQLEKKRIKLHRKKLRSSILKFLFFIGSIWMFFQIYGTQLFWEYLLMLLICALLIVFFISRLLGIQYPLEYLKEDYYKLLLNNFISEYHPNIKSTFNHGLRLEKTILRGRFESFKYKHEESYELSYKNVKATVCNTTFSSELSENDIFDYQILRIKLKGKKFPKTEFRANKDYSIFNKKVSNKNWPHFVQQKNSNLHYFTEDLEQFKKHIAPILPLITHLKSKGSYTNILLEGDEIIFLIKEIHLTLDYPIKNTKNTFLDKSDAEKLARKINTVLMIADSLNNELSKTEVEERLELKILDLIGKEEIKKTR